MKADWDLTPDTDRESRLGFDETIFCQGKTVEQIARLLQAAEADEETLLLTRLEPSKRNALPADLAAHLDYDEISHTAFLGRIKPVTTKAQVCVVSAGSSDVKVACEANRTLQYYGVGTKSVHDVGVAGLWRLLDKVEELRQASVVISVAGMEGTLPSVVAGLVPGVVIAVPTSNGYGVAAGGQAALSSALASCAPGLVVVNIDNGYGAACAALRIINAVRSSSLRRVR